MCQGEGVRNEIILQKTFALVIRFADEKIKGTYTRDIHANPQYKFKHIKNYEQKRE
jgi:hypothetical protein